MRKTALIAGMAMAAMAGGLAIVESPRALEAGPEPIVPRKKPAATAHAPRKASKRMPHIGMKERARHAGKTDGSMHGLPPLHRKGAAA